MAASYTTLWDTTGEDRESLILPQVERSSARAEATRINGMKGGARRKGETLEQRRERRQRELMLPIAGGVPEPMRNPVPYYYH